MNILFFLFNNLMTKSDHSKKKETKKKKVKCYCVS